MECDNRFYLYTGHKFLCTISSTSVTIKKSPLSNFRIVSEQGRTKDLKTQNWQLYKSPERASAVSTNIWGDQPSRRSGSGFIVFGSEAWVPVTSLGACDQSVCLEEYQLPVELDTKDLPQFLLLLGSALGESWVVWVDSAWHCTSPHLQRVPVTKVNKQTNKQRQHFQRRCCMGQCGLVSHAESDMQLIRVCGRASERQWKSTEFDTQGRTLPQSQ